MFILWMVCMMVVIIPSSSVLLLPPLSTLFPYTTLFRSVHLGHVTVEQNDLVWLGINRSAAQRFQRLPAAIDGGYAHVDRKSTRLNSSHMSISYAVFCLKKKTSLFPTSSTTTYDVYPLDGVHDGGYYTVKFCVTTAALIHTLSLHDALPICPSRACDSRAE